MLEAVGVDGVGAAVTVAVAGTGGHPVARSDTLTVYVPGVFTEIDCVVAPVLHE